MKIAKCGWGVNVIDHLHSEKVIHKTPTLGWLQEFLNFYFLLIMVVSIVLTPSLIIMIMVSILLTPSLIIK